MPWDTLLLSVCFFVVIPLLLGAVIRIVCAAQDQRKRPWLAALDKRVIPAMDALSMGFLILMVVLLFISQATTLVANILDILIIAIPLILTTIIIWALTFAVALWILKLPYNIAGPATLIACSNFFEMAVAIAVALYGPDSGAALATVVGVLIEVPVMLLLVWINNRNKHLFPL